MQRRAFLKHSVVAGSGLAVGACQAAPQVQSPTPRGGMPADLRDMAREVLATDDVLALALKWAERGVGFRDLLGVAWLAAIQEIDPSPIGGPVHAMMMVPSAQGVAEVLRGRQKLAPALFNLQRVKRSVGRDAGKADWRMPPPPAVEEQPREEAVAAFRTAMQEWDEAGADRAVCALHPMLSLHGFFELVWPFAIRDFRIIGHKAIYATQTFRVLQDVGWRLGRDGVRSLVLGVLDQDAFGAFDEKQSRHILQVNERNVSRAAALPPTWAAGAADEEASFALLEHLRRAGTDADAAAEAVVSALKKGVSAASAWDGVRLCGFELLMQYPGIAGVHPVTSINALYRASLITTQEPLRRQMLLQAASWLPMFLPILRGRRESTGRRIDTLKAGGRADPFAVADPGDSSGRAFRRAAAARREFGHQALVLCARKATHDHHYKFTVAAVEEIAAAGPAVRPFLAGASMSFLLTARDEDNEAWRRST